MLAKEVYPDKRRRQRLNKEFEISLLHQFRGRTKNVSANGAYFEVITNDIDAFCPGTIIPLKITTINMTFDSTVMKFCLSGKGLIICREVIEETTGCGIKLNLAVQFVEKLTME
jgi:hypothetical protein